MWGSTQTNERFLDEERQEKRSPRGTRRGDPTMPVEESIGKSARILGAYRFDFDICREERFKPEGWRPPHLLRIDIRADRIDTFSPKAIDAL